MSDEIYVPPCTRPQDGHQWLPVREEYRAMPGELGTRTSVHVCSHCRVERILTYIGKHLHRWSYQFPRHPMPEWVPSEWVPEEAP